MLMVAKYVLAPQSN